MINLKTNLPVKRWAAQKNNPEEFGVNDNSETDVDVHFWGKKLVTAMANAKVRLGIRPPYYIRQPLISTKFSHAKYLYVMSG